MSVQFAMLAQLLLCALFACCSLACEVGYWGTGCTMRCYCLDADEACDSRTGRCAISGCAHQYMGESCNEQLPDLGSLPAPDVVYIDGRDAELEVPTWQWQQPDDERVVLYQVEFRKPDEHEWSNHGEYYMNHGNKSIRTHVILPEHRTTYQIIIQCHVGPYFHIKGFPSKEISVSTGFNLTAVVISLTAVTSLALVFIWVGLCLCFRSETCAVVERIRRRSSTKYNTPLPRDSIRTLERRNQKENQQGVANGTISNGHIPNGTIPNKTVSRSRSSKASSFSNRHSSSSPSSTDAHKETSTCSSDRLVSTDISTMSHHPLSSQVSLLSTTSSTAPLWDEPIEEEIQQEETKHRAATDECNMESCHL